MLLVPAASFMPTAAAWTPLSLPSLWGFWRADMGVTQSSSLVSSWVDQSPNAFALTESTHKPTFVTNFNTSFDGVQFASASSTKLANTSIILTAGKPLSVFGLSSNSSVSSDGRMASYISSNGVEDTSPSFTIYTPNADQLAMYSGPSGVLGNGGTGIGATHGTNVLWEWVCDGTNENAYKATTVQGSATSASQTYGQAGAATFYFGAGHGPAKFYDGTIAFFGIMQAAMSSSDRSKLKSWTNTNWGTSF